MAKKSKKKQKSIQKTILELVIALVLTLIVGYLYRDTAQFGHLASPDTLGDGKAYFHFIDVGQGDSTLVTAGDYAVLIDTGSASEADFVSTYVNSYTDKVDYLILTHPHEDHMGSAAEVLEQVTVENVILSAAASDARYFTKFLDVVEAQGINVIEAIPGDSYTLGELTLRLLAPLSLDDDNPNNSSVVIRMDVGSTSALFTGDAEKEVEEALLDHYAPADLDCDLLHAGHHGSSTSNSASFVNTVSPAAVIISCGKNNSYGHPHAEVLDRLALFNIEVFRTDDMGSIVLKSDGMGISRVE